MAWAEHGITQHGVQGYGAWGGCGRTGRHGKVGGSPRDSGPLGDISTG